MNDYIKTVGLGAYLSTELLVDVVETTWSGKKQVRGLSVIFASMGVFQKGAILGRAKSDDIETLVKLIAKEGSEEDAIEQIKTSTEESLKEYGKEPNSFYDFLEKTVYPEIDFTNLKTLKTIYNQKSRLVEILPKFQVDLATGVGFGAFHPELVQKMWVTNYETEKEPHLWAEFRQSGLDLPEKQDLMPIAEMEGHVLEEVSEWAQVHKPHLIEPLGLSLQDR